VGVLRPKTKAFFLTLFYPILLWNEVVKLATRKKNIAKSYIIDNFVGYLDVFYEQCMFHIYEFFIVCNVLVFVNLSKQDCREFLFDSISKTLEIVIKPFAIN
jgi:hypothetical protein